MPEPITDHVWRPPLGSHQAQRAPLLERPCAYMSCKRPIGEHVYMSNPVRTVKWRRGERERVVGSELGSVA